MKSETEMMVLLFMVLKLEEAQEIIPHSWQDKFHIDQELDTGVRQMMIKILFLPMMMLLEIMS